MYHDTEFNLSFSLFTENSGDSTVTGGSHYGIVHLNTFRRDQQFMINKSKLECYETFQRGHKNRNCDQIYAQTP